MATRSTAWLWIAAGALLVAAKLWLVAAQTVQAIGPAGHDDRLFLELANHLLQGQWLGDYHKLTLAKGPMYSFWIAVVAWTGLPLFFAQHLLYAAACAMLVFAVRPWLPARWVLLVLFAALLFNPITFDTGVHSRVLRQEIYHSLTMLTLAGMLTLAARPAAARSRELAGALLTGAAFAGFWLTREEGIWFLPLLAVLGFWIWWERWRLGAAGRGARLGTLGLAVAVAGGLLALVAGLNWLHYGVFTTCEFRAGPFRDAYGALARAGAAVPKPYVPVPRAVRERLYPLSPAFAELQPFLEGQIGDGWVAASAPFTHEPTGSQEIAGGWFMWALRDAVAAAGHAASAADAMRYYRQLAKEVNAACDRQLVPAGPRRSGFQPVMDADAWERLAASTGKTAVFFFTFDGVRVFPVCSSGSPESLVLFAQLTRERLTPVDSAATAAEAAQHRFRLGVLEAIARFYQQWASVFGLAALVAWIVTGVAALRARALTLPLVLNTGLLGSIAAILLLNAAVDATSFPTITTGSFTPAYPLWILFMFTAWLQVGRSPTADGASDPVPARATPFLPDRPELRWNSSRGLALGIVAGCLVLGSIGRWLDRPRTLPCENLRAVGAFAASETARVSQPFYTDAAHGPTARTVGRWATAASTFLWIALLATVVAGVIGRSWPTLAAIHRPLVSLMGVALTGYLLFWAYFADPRLGDVCWIAGTIAALAWWWIHADAARALWREDSWWRVWAALLAVGMIYLGFLHFAGNDAPWSWLAANRYNPGLPSDHIIPQQFAERLLRGESPRHLTGDWLSSDRPPLQTGWVLLLGPGLRTGPDHFDALGQAMGFWLQMAWLPALVAFFQCLGASGRRALALTFVVALSAFVIVNTQFVWPKMAAAAFTLGAWILLGATATPATDARHWAAAGIALALAFLCHGGSAFAILALLAIWLRPRRAFPWRGLAVLGVGAALICVPWFAYQRFYEPPGNRLIKWHLAGVVPIDSRGTWETLRDSYRQRTFPELWQARSVNLFRVFREGDWGQLANFSSASPQMRRAHDFFHLLRSVGWWNLGLLGLPLVWWRTAQRDRGSARAGPSTVLAATFVWLAATLALWILLMFDPGSAFIHQGSYVPPLVLIGLGIWSLHALHPLVLTAVALPAAAYFFAVYGFSPPTAFAATPVWAVLVFFVSGLAAGGAAIGFARAWAPSGTVTRTD